LLSALEDVSLLTSLPVARYVSNRLKTGETNGLIIDLLFDLSNIKLIFKKTKEPTMLVKNRLKTGLRFKSK
jgi:hypothetical protein